MRFCTCFAAAQSEQHAPLSTLLSLTFCPVLYCPVQYFEGVSDLPGQNIARDGQAQVRVWGGVCFVWWMELGGWVVWDGIGLSQGAPSCTLRFLPCHQHNPHPTCPRIHLHRSCGWTR